jgi:cyclin-dependent kinase regulatory subunit CKS1
LENLAGKEIQKSKKKKQKKNKNKNSLFSSDIVANVRDFCKRQERKKESENVKEKKKKRKNNSIMADAARRKAIVYSPRYSDEKYVYRHVILPRSMVCLLPTDRLMLENEWRSLGVQQSPGWVHYAIHTPEPHILLFRRPKDD